MMMLRLPIVLVLVASVLTLVMHTGAVHAQPIAGTEYTGTHDAGGILHFIVSPAGDRITALDVDGIAGGGCSWDLIDLSNWGGAISVTDGHFSATNADGDAIVGQFVAGGRAEGTIQIHDPVKGCETPPLRWVAASPG